jgi:hypothetical protein
MSENESEHVGLDPIVASYLSDSERVETWRLRWAGRLVGVLFGGFFAMFAVAEVIGGVQAGEFDPEGIAPVSLILIAALGVLLSFYWERAGGILTLIGGLGMALLVIINGGFSDLGVALLFALPLGTAGSLSLMCGNRAT